jgi:cytochrome c551/c552
MKMILAVAAFFAAAVMAFPALAEVATAVRSDEGDRMQRVAADRGCTLCHREATSPRAPGDAVPLAPSWREVAARHRGRADAEERLTRIVVEGADPGDRHWKNRIEFAAMRGNAPGVTPDEARALVRWILSQP